MVSYLVMKNNMKRLLWRKSNYFIMLIIPVLLVLVGTLSVRIENKQLRVGILGSDAYIRDMSSRLQMLDGVTFANANKDAINTDQIMGKYQIVLNEKDGNRCLAEIQNYLQNKVDSQTAFLSARKRMASMLLTIYMTITTLYGMKYLSDKREGAVERVCISGGRKSSYLMGCFYSTAILTAFQLAIILSCWKFWDGNFSFSFVETVRIFVFILLISNLYGIVVIMISKSEMMAGILGSSGAVLCSLLGGTFVAVDKMPHFLQILSIVSPMRWLLNGIL